MTQPDLFHRPDPVPYRRGSRTSRAAAERISQSPQVREAKRDRLLAAYQAAGVRGLTDHEASEATGFPRSSICSLRARLLAEDKVQARMDGDGKVTRLGPFTHRQQVWVAR